MDVGELRAEFPVLGRVAYLNAGTDGPVPRAAARAASDRIAYELERGRSGSAYFKELLELGGGVRERLARLYGADPAAIGLTRSTTDGVATALMSLPLGPGDEVVTSDEEHPGLLIPLAAARRRAGFDVRSVPFAEVAGAVGARTKLVACSHVSWVGGAVVDTAALARAGARVLLDGAQGLGAVAVAVERLGCDFYAAAGQKWLCGPDGSGSVYVRPGLADELDPPWPNYMSLIDPNRADELVAHPGARRFDLGVPPGPASAWLLASLDLLERAGWDWLHERARASAAALAATLRERGVEVAARGDSTLVSWRSADPEGDVERLAAAGLVVRAIPRRGLVRASVGAWTVEGELERLAAAAVP